MRRLFVSSWLMAGLVVGCRKADHPPLVDTGLAPVPTQAQPRLHTMKIYLGPHELATEIAMRPLELQTGMMFRESMAETEGMLFVMGRPHQASFYMKNTKVPLSCAYIDSEGVIQEIYDMKPFDETSIVAKSNQIVYVLEVPQGWFERHQVKPGAVLRTERGSLQETFFGRQ